MKKTGLVIAGCSTIAGLALIAGLCFAEGYTFIDTNNGEGPVTWSNTDEPADGPAIATIIADAQRVFPEWINEKNMTKVKSYFVKSFNTQRKSAAEWQPIDHIEAMMVGLTAPVNGGTDYYLYNCEMHYNRPIGQTKWTVDKQESNMTLGDGTPKMGGIHLIAADGTDKTQAGIADQTRRDEEEYARIHANDNQKKGSGKSESSVDESKSGSSDKPAVEEKVEKKKSVLGKLKGFGM